MYCTSGLNENRATYGHVMVEDKVGYSGDTVRQMTVCTSDNKTNLNSGLDIDAASKLEQK